MEKTQELMLAVWRESCRHIEIHEAAANLAALLRKHAPLERMLVLRFDAEHASLVTAAAAPTGENSKAIPSVIPCEPSDLKRLMQWSRKAETVHLSKASRPPRELAPLDGLVGAAECLVAPLAAASGPIGLVLLVAEPGRSFTKTHASLLSALKEPFSVALENDKRLHEMAALREAAEADRSSLLRRLGRQELGDTIIGESVGLRQVMERVTMVGRSDAPVLILGETGAGKELIARAIHNRSNRSQGPFIRVNCGAVPPELIDSQLFGHEKGSFTGASESRKGWFERADGGTLFLDEIGELPLDAQVRFLRVLQDGSLERVGAHDAMHVDVRVVAATHRDLASMVREGKFREDLWYRIAIFPILLPPLRDRRDDIPELVAHLAERAAVRFGLPPTTATPEELAMLKEYHWPGNIRELGAVIDRAAILGGGKRLEIRAALGFGPSPGVIGAAAVQSPAPISPPAPFRASDILPLDEAMKRHIELALRATRGRVEGPRGTAAILKINPHTLRARMRKLRINWKQFRELDE